MTTFPRSPRVLKGALISFNLPNPTPSVIVFQYNPATLTRTLNARTSGGEGGGQFEPMRLSGAPVETITLTVEFDATDKLERADGLTIALGVHAQLAALEVLLYPTSTSVLTNLALLNAGVIEIVPPRGPFTLFFYGPNRILPVQVTSFSVTEEAHDVLLNPIRASVDLDLRVLSYNDLDVGHPGHAIFLAHQVAKETMAALTTVTSVAGVAGDVLNLP